MRRITGSVVLAALAAVGCRDSAGASADGAPDRPGDASVLPDGTQGLSVDFAVVGCPAFDETEQRCHGTAPLTVSFVPITSPAVTAFLWDFGDKSPTAVARTPGHTFVLPGSYEVTLTVAAGQDSLTRARPRYIVVAPAATGALCDVDGQCEADRKCLCVPGTPGCPDAFARGLCTATCTDVCSADATCVDLRRSAGGDPIAAMDPWRTSLCLAKCSVDAECPVGLRCRTLPASGGSWVNACFVTVPASVGTPCRGATGALEDGTCVSGHCADLGALGSCSLDCRASECPSGTACASFGDGRTLCVKACADARACGDPWLGCQSPGGSRPLDFTTSEPGAYCTPARCVDKKECGEAGACLDGFCGPAGS